MKGFSNNDYKLLTSLLKLPEPKLHQFLYKFLSDNYDKVIEKDEYIYAEGNIPIALVAHTDTVYPTTPSHIYYDKEQGVLWSPEGLGADDRAGIFAIIQIIRMGLKPYIIFTNYEEVGAIGAEVLVKEISAPNINYIIELDRRGIDDCVFYNCDNKAFVEYIESFDFKESFGTFSDISEICPGWGIAGVNLSIGYKNEHSLTETLYIAPMLSTIKKVIMMLREKDIPFFKYVEMPTPVVMPRLNEKFIKCNGKCGLHYYEHDLIHINMADGTNKYYCPDCCVQTLEWCDLCGNPFEKDGEFTICPTCRSKT